MKMDENAPIKREAEEAASPGEPDPLNRPLTRRDMLDMLDYIGNSFSDNKAYVARKLYGAMMKRWTEQ